MNCTGDFIEMTMNVRNFEMANRKYSYRMVWINNPLSQSLPPQLSFLILLFLKIISPATATRNIRILIP